MIPEIHIEDYNYPLPDGRIAKYPLPERDSSKLLRYEAGHVDEFVFRQLPDLLPDHAVMVFNDTKVVPARMHFQRATGAHIEIFCLEPVSPVEYATAFAATETCTWKCVIGNAKKWKEDVLTLFRTPETPDMGLEARLLSREGQTGVVEFRWTDGSPFSRVLEVCGTVPIPPYLNRESEKIDIERYQTLYAHIRGSVAAPTAGLHFTEDVLTRIKAKGIDTETVCLHVGAGTFLPVKSSLVSEHPMHREPFVVKLQLLKDICRMDRKWIAVGTTSVRTLESLYYVGVSCLEKGAPEDVAQWAPYEREYPYSTQDHCPRFPVPPGGPHGHELPSAGEHVDPAGFRLCRRGLAHDLRLRACAWFPVPQLRGQLAAGPRLINWLYFCTFASYKTDRHG